MSNVPLKKLAWRSFTSVLLGTIFIAMVISGAVLFSPRPAA